MRRLIALLLWLALTGRAVAAPVPNQPIWPQTPKEAIGVISNGSGTTAQALYAGGPNGSKVSAISCSSTDTASHNLLLYLNHSSTNYLIATVSIAANAGNSTTVAPQPLLGLTIIPNIAVDQNGIPYLYVNSGDTLEIAVSAAVTSGDQVACIATLGDF
jgi:hypothetical protein